MRKTKVKVLALLLAAGVLCAGTTTAYAETISRSLKGNNFTCTTEITSTTAMARTLASGPSLSVSVDATYHYVDLDKYVFEEERSSDAGRMGARVDFTVPSEGDYRSYDVKATHTAQTLEEDVYEREVWLGHTTETY